MATNEHTDWLLYVFLQSQKGKGGSVVRKTTEEEHKLPTQ